MAKHHFALALAFATLSSASARLQGRFSDPFREMFDRMDKIFEEETKFFESLASNTGSSINVDKKSADGSVKISIGGVSADKLDASVRDGVLTIKSPSVLVAVRLGSQGRMLRIDVEKVVTEEALQQAQPVGTPAEGTATPDAGTKQTADTSSTKKAKSIHHSSLQEWLPLAVTLKTPEIDYKKDTGVLTITLQALNPAQSVNVTYR